MNNAKGIGIHIFIGIVTLILLMLSPGYTANAKPLMTKGYLILITIIVLFLYILSARLLTNFNSAKKNLFSVSLVSLIGLVMWSIFFSLPHHGDLEWILFYAYNHSFQPVINFFQPATNFSSLTINLIIAFLPSILLFIGIQLKGSK